MKATFICLLPAITVGALVSSACVAFEPLPEDDVGGETGEADTACDDDECEPTHELSGELILFVNARLSDEDAGFQSHLPLAEEGTYVGNTLYVYDPTRECDDGGNACRLSELGKLRLDDRLGEISVQDNSLRKFVARDLAYHPDHGLWAASFDPLNDEWSVSALGVDDWHRTDNTITVDRWVIPPGPAESPSTDPCYWFEAISGLGFAGDDLLIGVRGAGSKGLVTDGSLLRVDLKVLDQGHCVHSSDISQDPNYYACDVVCEQWCSFGAKVGVAGDVIEDHDGVGASAWLRSEDDGVMPLGHNELSTCVAPTPGEVASAQPDNVFIEDVVRGDEIDGLARVGGQLYGLSVLGKIYAIDEDQRIVEQIDDLGPLFPENGLRLRGAAEILIPPN
ncbi:hypothetical protein ENSA5_35250 [Enhygromyxa salina]|uniref:Lipoprotein n=1 Tax=Enhygromyxa salina TaxID=215803 RepID=A0A2S9XVL5_9BACT|nr:hypothetical protein [Enhygromyxa salina]PRP96751.1 hypothetical protein ENSA5_35250 [Enhygromyxa salina]